ncbi:MAG TPA: hypothetical protein VL128_05005 [Candidatus Eisenbacteria bacterium]|nr:hypothetical protein [Candidatus Eisenbacteria bacterium]
MTVMRRYSIVILAWLALVAAVWHWVIPLPQPDDGEYSKWLLMALITGGIPWAIDLSILLGICLSLTTRLGRARLWILRVWGLGFFGPLVVAFLIEGLSVNANWKTSIPASLDALAFPWLLVLLLLLAFVLRIETEFYESNHDES